MKNPIKCEWKTLFRIGLVLLLCVAQTLSAQDTQFSQQRLTPLLVNPAQTGVDHLYRAHFVYRSASLDPEALSVNSASASFDMRLGQNKRSPNHFGVGINFLTDRISGLGYRSSRIKTSAAYHIKSGKDSFLSMGLNLDYTSASTSITNNGQRALEDGNSAFLNGNTDIDADEFSGLSAGLGVAFRTDKAPTKRDQYIGKSLNAGLAVYQIGTAKFKEAEGLNREIKPRYTGHIRFQLPLGNRLGVVPSAYAHYQDGEATVISRLEAIYVIHGGDVFNSRMERLTVSAGAALRNTEALVLNSFLRWGDYAIGIAYDVGGIPSGESETQNAIEVGIRYRLNTVNGR